MPARLTIHFPSGPAKICLLPDGGETVVGRDESCDVVLEDDRVSRRHAVLACDGPEWSIRDAGSKNGTFIGGLPVESQTLEERSWISFGGLIACFERLSVPVERVEE